MTAPAVQRLGDAVLLQGPAVHDVAYLVGLGIRYRAQTDGYAPSPNHRRLLALLSDVSVSLVPELPCGSAEVPQAVDLSGWDRMGSAQAARLLGITSRQVRNLALELGGRRVKGAWVFDRAALAAEVSRRNEGKPSE